MAMDRVDPKAAAARGATFALAAWRLIMRAVVIILFCLFYYIVFMVVFFGVELDFFLERSVLVMSPFFASPFLHAAFGGVGFGNFILVSWIRRR